MSTRRNQEAIHRTLTRLDALLVAHPELKSPEVQRRLSTWLSQEEHRVMTETDTKTQQLFVRVPLGLVQALDNYVAKIRAEHPGLRPTRSDAIRELLYKVLADLQAEDQADTEAAREALADPERIPYDQARRELGL